MSHDPLKFAGDFNAKLSTRSRHVCAFLGAGVARACNLPDVSQLQDKVLSELNAKQRAAFELLLAGRNLEQALSRVRRIEALVGNQPVDGLNSTDAQALDRAVCQAIVKNLDVKGANLDPVRRFSAWAKRANYRLPLELFTVNYDLLLETALDDLRVPYFDGYTGTLRARFQTNLVEAMPGVDEEWLPSFFVRLWKLHGSVNWAWDGSQIVRLGYPVPADQIAAIYPSDMKYVESRRVPFVVLQDRLRRALNQPETLVIVSGYSFNDDDLNELIFDAAARRKRSDFVVFCHSDIPTVLSERAAVTPTLQVAGAHKAILGGVSGDWKGADDLPEDVWKDNKLALGDFRSLAAYLARSTSSESEDILGGGK